MSKKFGVDEQRVEVYKTLRAFKRSLWNEFQELPKKKPFMSIADATIKIMNIFKKY